jgi:hypothetical protein
VTPDINAPLSAEEFASLKAIADRPISGPVPDAHIATLFDLGFIEVVRAEPSVMPLGIQDVSFRPEAAFEGRVRWLSESAPKRPNSPERVS